MSLNSKQRRVVVTSLAPFTVAVPVNVYRDKYNQVCDLILDSDLPNPNRGGKIVSLPCWDEKQYQEVKALFYG